MAGKQIDFQRKNQPLFEDENDRFDRSDSTRLCSKDLNGAKRNGKKEKFGSFKEALKFSTNLDETEQTGKTVSIL